MNNYRLQDLVCTKEHKCMLFKTIKALPVAKIEYACGWGLLAGVILLVGLISPAKAAPENIHNEGEEPSFNLSFPASRPITISSMIVIGRPEIRYTDGEQLEEVVGTDSEAMRLKDDSPSDTALTLGSGYVPRNLVGVQIVPSDTPGPIFSTEWQSEANKLASNIDAASKEREDNVLEREKLMIEGAITSPFASIALAVIALLGLVSVARRNDI